MAKKILLAVDGSEKGNEAVAVVGKFLKDHPDLEVLLFHCVPQLATLLPGELCVGLEESGRVGIADQERVGQKVIEECRRCLVNVGFSEKRISCEVKTDSLDAAEDIQLIAGEQKIRSVAVGRRGRSQLETLLLGSVSSKVALYSRHHSVWIIDTPVHETRKVLVPMQGTSDARALIDYVAEFIAPIPQLYYTFLHLMPPVPPTFWDDGHILGPAELRDRQARIEKWRSEWRKTVDEFMGTGRDLLTAKGVPEDHVKMEVRLTKEGIGRDLLNEISTHKYQVVVMGKRSFHERKPFLMGSHANKILQNVKGSMLCMVDA